MAEKKKNTVVLVNPATQAVQDLVKQLEDGQLAEIMPVESADEGTQIAMQFQPCLIISCIQHNADVPARVQMLKKLENNIKHQGVKVLMMSKIKNRQVADLMTSKLGVSDFIEEPSPARTVLFKTKKLLASIDTFRKIQDAKKAQQEQIVFKKSEQKQGEAANTIKAKQRPALGVPGDTFLFRNNGLKKNGKKVLVELEGPDPETGEWVKHEDKGDGKTSWRWVPNEEKEAQEKGTAPKDGWVHEGEKPHFNEKTKKWQMLSEKPDLSLMKDGKKIAEKISTDESGEVTVADDSPEAEENVRKNLQKAQELKKARAPKEIKRKQPGEKEGEGENAEGETKLSGDTEKDGKEDPQKLKTLGKAAAPKENPFAKKAGAEEENPEAKAKLEKILAEKKKAVSPFGKKLGESGTEDNAADENKILGEGEAEEDEANLTPAMAALKKLQKKRDTERKLGEKAEGEEDEAAEKEKLLKAALPAKDRPKKELKTLDKLAGLRDLVNKSSSVGEGEEGNPGDEDTLLGAAEGEEEGEVEPGAISLGKKPKVREKGLQPLRPVKAKRPKNDEEKQAGMARAAAARQRRQDLLKQIQEKIKNPPKENLEDQEEEEIRDELGLKGRPEISKKDLAKRKQLADLKKAKKELGDLDLEIADAESDEIEHNTHDLTPDELANTQSMRNAADLAPDELKGITGAHDSEDQPEDEDDAGNVLKKRRQNKTKEKRNLYEDEAQYMPEADLQPLGNAWEVAGDFYVYLDAQTRYRGFEKLEDLMPIWVFAGDAIPELLDKTKQWRFYGGLPVHAKTVKDLPADVRDFLLSLRDEAKGEAAAEEENPEEDDKMAKLRKSLEGAEEDLAGEPEEEFAEAEDTTAEEDVAEESHEEEAESEDFSGKKGKKKRDQDEDGAEETETTADAEEEAEEPGEISDFDRLKKRLEVAEETAAEGRDSADESESATNGPSTLDSLRARLSAGEESLESSEKTSGDLPAAEENGAEGLQDKLAKTTSPGIQDFLERRKAKQAADDALGENESKAQEQGPVRAPTHLAILVALSDALFPNKDFERGMAKVLQSIEISFPDCHAFVTALPDSQNSAAVRARARGSQSTETSVPIDPAFSFPIRNEAGANNEVLGYLVLKPTGPREKFSPEEEIVAKKVATGMWPLLVHPDVAQEAKAA
jgi:hypothetical protein